jgi:restriction endonuclease S subunit
LKLYGEKVVAGSTFVEVSGKQMAKMPIRIPELLEQKKIGQFFTSVDNLITLHHRLRLASLAPVLIWVNSPNLRCSQAFVKRAKD